METGMLSLAQGLKGVTVAPREKEGNGEQTRATFTFCHLNKCSRGIALVTERSATESRTTILRSEKLSGETLLRLATHKETYRHDEKETEMLNIVKQAYW